MAATMLLFEDNRNYTMLLEFRNNNKPNRAFR